MESNSYSGGRLRSPFLLGIGRWLTGDGLDESDEDMLWIVIHIPVLAAFNAVVAWPIIWAALVNRWMLVWTLVAIAIALGEPELFCLLTSESVDESSRWWVNVVHFAWLYGSLIAMRLCGYRLVRRLDRTDRKGAL